MSKSFYCDFPRERMDEREEATIGLATQNHVSGLWHTGTVSR